MDHSEDVTPELRTCIICQQIVEVDGKERFEYHEQPLPLPALPDHTIACTGTGMTPAEQQALIRGK